MKRICLAFCVAMAACAPPTGSVVGRWQRIDKPREWLEFSADGRFKGRSFMASDTVLVTGTYEQRGATVTALSATGHRGTMQVRDTLLVMHDSTRFRRLKR